MLPPGAILILGASALALGCVVGSFLNVCIYRMPRDRSIVSPPSHCPQCGEKLHLTNLQQITRIPINAGFPWYRVTDKVWNLSYRYRNSRTGQSGYWCTFDSGPGNDTAQVGCRLVRLWAPVNIKLPRWLHSD